MRRLGTRLETRQRARQRGSGLDSGPAAGPAHIFVPNISVSARSAQCVWLYHGPGSTDRASSANAYWTHEPVKTARTSVSPNTQHRHLSRTSSGEIRPQSSENNPHTVSLNEQSWQQLRNRTAGSCRGMGEIRDRRAANHPELITGYRRREFITSPLGHDLAQRAYHRLSPPGRLSHRRRDIITPRELITGYRRREFITRHRSVPHRSGRHLPLCPGVVRHFTGLWAVFSGHSVRPHGGETEKKEGKEKREGEKEDRRVISKSRSGRGRSQYS